MGLGPYVGTVRFAPAHRLLRGHQKWEPRWPSVSVAVKVGELLLRAIGALIGDVEAAAGLVGEAGDGVEHAAGQDEAAGKG